MDNDDYGFCFEIEAFKIFDLDMKQISLEFESHRNFMPFGTKFKIVLVMGSIKLLN